MHQERIVQIRGGVGVVVVVVVTLPTLEKPAKSENIRRMKGCALKCMNKSIKDA